MKCLLTFLLLLGACSSGDSKKSAIILSDDPDSGQRQCAPYYPNECIRDMCRKEKFDCGSATSVFDANGCYRQTCTTVSDCGADEECREIRFAAPSCGFAPPDTSVCECGTLLGSIDEMHCFPIASH